MRQSNLYIVIFSALLTIILGGLLALTSEGLKSEQQKSVELDTKKQILGAVMEVDSDVDVLELYSEVIKSEVVDYQGNVVEKNEEGKDIIPEKIDISKQFKKAPEERLYPIFKYFEKGSDEVESYVLPVFGKGLWDDIWGYIAVDPGYQKITGAVFAHAGETPGLGARITEQEVQQRYQGKEIYNDQGELVSVTMLKGENNPESKLDEHHVDGMSGATITGNGVDEMLKNYFSYYEAYFKNAGKTALLN